MEPLPVGTHLIHIGPQKTGSTTIQRALHRARDELRTHGVVYPGPEVKPRAAAEGGLGFARLHPRGDSRGAWEDLLAQVHEPGARRVCISLEAFGRADDDQIERIVGELGGAAPHVVAVARRYDRLLPSQWQQRVQAGLRLSYAEWLRVVLGPPSPSDPHWANLWVPHDTVSLVNRWSRVLGPDRFTLIVSDDSDPGLLARTFESLLGVPEGLLRDRSKQANTSLTYPRTELLRRLNVVFHEQGWTAEQYFDLVRRGVVPTLTSAARSPRESATPPVPDWARDRLVEISDRRVAELAQLPLRVVGDLDQLRVDPPATTETSTTEVTDVPIELVTAALEGMARSAVDRQRRSGD